MSTTPAATILSRRFPGKRAFITGGASGLGRAMATELAGDGWTLGLLDLSAQRLEATAAELTAAGRGELHIVWPKNYRLAWRLKRLFPGWFVRRIGSLREQQLARSSPPRG